MSSTAPRRLPCQAQMRTASAVPTMVRTPSSVLNQVTGMRNPNTRRSTWVSAQTGKTLKA